MNAMSERREGRKEGRRKRMISAKRRRRKDGRGLNWMPVPPRGVRSRGQKI